MRTIFFTLFWMALAFHSCWAGAKWYVSPSGNDNHAGTLAAPFKSLTKAIDAAAPGDTIELRGGQYVSSEIRINKSNLTIRSYAGEWAVIRAVTNVEDVSSCLWYNEPETVGGTLERLEIIGGYYYGLKFESNWDWDNSVPFSKRKGVSNVIVRNCIIHDTGRDAIKLTPACTGIQILQCEIYNTGKGPGALLDFNAEGVDNVNAPNMLVKGCYIHDIATTGVYAKGGARNCRIEGNVIANCGEGGIYLGFYTDAEWFDTQSNPEYHESLDGLVLNNLIMNTGHAGIGLWGAKNAQIYHNTVINGAKAEMASLFLNTGDIWLSDTRSARPRNQGAKILNNIFIQAAGQNQPICRIREHAGSQSNSLDYNAYFRSGTPPVFLNDSITWEDLSLSQWKTQNATDAHSLGADPKVDANGRLLGDSPCINSGTATVLVPLDREGGLRDNRPDIGADEFGVVSGLSTVFESSGAHVRIRQNPVLDNTLCLEVQLPQAVQTQLQILSASGQVLLRKNIDVSEGEQTLDWPLTGLPTGAYWVKVAGVSRLFFKP